MPTLACNPLDPLSNSFSTVAEAETYLDSRLYSESWDTATSVNKQRSLIWASMMISNAYTFDGRRVQQRQILSFPRFGLKTPDGFSVDSDEYPALVVRATQELALFLLSSNPSSDSPLDAGISEIKVDTLMLKYSKSEMLAGNSDDGSGIPARVEALLKDFIEASKTGGGKTVNLRRT